MDRYLKAMFSLETIVKYKNAAAGVVGASSAPFLEQAFSSGKFLCYLLLLVIIVGDWISGTAAAKKTKTYSSEYGQAGAVRTMLILWIPLIGLVLDMVITHAFKVTQPGYAYYFLTLMLAYHNMESLTANTARAGWERWIPRSILSYVSSEIKAKADRSEKQKGAAVDATEKSE